MATYELITKEEDDIRIHMKGIRQRLNDLDPVEKVLYIRKQADLALTVQKNNYTFVIAVARISREDGPAIMENVNYNWRTGEVTPKS